MRRFGVALILLAAGCGDKPGDAPAPPAAGEPARTFERGPLKATLAVEPKEPALTDIITLSIEAEIEDGYTLAMPEFAEGLGDFAVRDYHADAPVAAAGKTIHRARYELEVFVSGEYKIRPMVFSFTGGEGEAAVPEKTDAAAGETSPAPEKSPPASDAMDAAPEDTEPAAPPAPPEEKVYKLKTEDIAVVVKPLPDEASRGELAPPAGPAEMPAPPSTIAYYAAGGIAAAAAIGLALFFFLRGRLGRVPAAPPIPPHERAFRELRALLDEELIAKGRIKEFFFRLTFVVRTYIERRFGLRAPEQTTEEFLPTAAGSGLLSPAHQQLLKDFLDYADLVKYAAYMPGVKDIENSFNAARRFINETVPAPAQGGSHAPA